MLELPTWLLVIPVVGFLVFVHELGHFITAKWFGIKVTEFGFGFPPRLMGIRHGETTYSINWIPLGGFVKMLGEEDPTDPRSFACQSTFRRIVVLCAGSLMNLVVPLVIFTVLFTIPHDSVIGSVVIGGVAPHSPAELVGLRSGDTILTVDGHSVDNHADLIRRVTSKLGESINLTIRKGAIVSGLSTSPEIFVTETVLVKVRSNPPTFSVVAKVTDPDTEVSLDQTQKYDTQLKVGDVLSQGPMGIKVGTVNPRIVRRSYPLWTAFPMSLQRIKEVVVISKNVITRWGSGGPDPGLTGPVGIAKITGEVARAGVIPVFELMALISISLAIINILPIPALDGGRLMFVIIEWTRGGKRISPQRENLIHLFGFVILISLIVVVSYRDILRLLNE